MPIPIKNEINIVFSTLPDLINAWNTAMQKAFAEEQEGQKVEVLEAILNSLPDMQEKFDSEIDKLSKKIKKEIAKEKKKISSL
jgi:flagellar hook-associated protein FlgK